MLKLKEVDPKILRDVRSDEEPGRGAGKTISYLLHIFSNIHEFNVGKSYLYIGDNSATCDIARTQFEFWLAEAGFGCYHNRNTIIIEFVIKPRGGLMGIWDTITKPRPPYKIKIEFMSVELGSSKLGTKQIEEVIVDVAIPKRKYFARQLTTATATGRNVYV